MTPRNDIFTDAKNLGIEERQRIDPLPRLALMVAQASADRQINIDDADDLYASYLGVPTEKARALNPTSFRANASKLRRVIEAADAELVERAIKIRQRLAREIEGFPAYQLIVAACRLRIKQGRRVTNADLERLIRQA
jgi:hypothetical protein